MGKGASLNGSTFFADLPMPIIHRHTGGEHMPFTRIPLFPGIVRHRMLG